MKWSAWAVAMLRKGISGHFISYTIFGFIVWVASIQVRLWAVQLLSEYSVHACALPQWTSNKMGLKRTTKSLALSRIFIQHKFVKYMIMVLNNSYEIPYSTVIHVFLEQSNLSNRWYPRNQKWDGDANSANPSHEYFYEIGQAEQTTLIQFPWKKSWLYLEPKAAKLSLILSKKTPRCAERDCGNSR